MVRAGLPWVTGTGFAPPGWAAGWVWAGPGAWTGAVWRTGGAVLSAWTGSRWGRASGTMERGLSRDTGIKSRANTTSHSRDSTRLGALRFNTSRSAATTAAA